MSHKGKAQFTLLIVAPPDKEAEGDRFFAAHAKWMEATHPREGDKALLRYNVSKGTEDSGDVCFILTEVYETDAGITNHFQQWGKSFPEKERDNFGKWMSECKVTKVPRASVIYSLW